MIIVIHDINIYKNEYKYIYKYIYKYEYDYHIHIHYHSEHFNRCIIILFKFYQNV